MTSPLRPHPWRLRPPTPNLTSCLAWLLLILAASQARGDDSPLELADLAAYRRALNARDQGPPPKPVPFRELWAHPATFQGQRIQVEGQVVRRFRQGAFGTFPPLVEAWAVTPRGDPFCLVYPASGSKEPALRDQVRFVGTYLKRIRYQGGDVERLAPLIVGPAPPTTAPRTAPPAARPWNPLHEWILGLAAAAVVVAVLAWQHFKKPISRTALLEAGLPSEFGTGPPEFLDRAQDRDDSSDEK